VHGKTDESHRTELPLIQCPGLPFEKRFRVFAFPMTIMDRHIGWSILLTTLFGVAVLSLVLVLGNLFREVLDLMISQNLPLKSGILFLFHVLPFSLAFSIPWAFLTALLLVFGRMSADNELVALHSNGVSILRVSVPVFIVALGLSGLCWWINAEAAPHSKQAMVSLISNFAANDPSSLFTPDDVVDKFPDRRIYIGKKEDDRFKNITIFEMDEAGTPSRMIFAKEGKLFRDHQDHGWYLRLYQTSFEERDRKDPLDVTKIRKGISVSEGTYRLPLDRLLEKVNKRKQTLSYFTLADLKKTIREGSGDQRLRAKVEFHKRFSLSLACLAFAVIAMPLGIITHRTETSVGYGIGLVVAFSYFFCTMVVGMFEINSWIHPVLLVWLPNILFGLFGAILLTRLARR